MPLEGVIAGPGALEQGMTGAAGTTHQKEVTFGGTTALMGLITTLIEETSSPLGCVGGSGTLWCCDGPCGVLGVLEDCLVGLEEFLWSWCPGRTRSSLN